MKVPNIAPQFQKEYKRIRTQELRSLVDVLVAELKPLVKKKKIQRYAFVFAQPQVEIVHIAFFIPEKKGFHLRLFCGNGNDFEFKLGCFEQITKRVRFDSWFDGMIYETFDDFFFDTVHLVNWVQN